MIASDGKVVHVYAMYCTLAKGALLGAQNPSEMGPMRGSKSLAFCGRGGAHFGGGAQIAPTPDLGGGATGAAAQGPLLFEGPHRALIMIFMFYGLS